MNLFQTNSTHKDRTETARQLFNYTRDHFNEIKDNLDVSFIADIVDDYLDVLREEKSVNIYIFFISLVLNFILTLYIYMFYS